ncbi:lysine 2,3-aminomutase [Streptomyces sp. NPDC001093]|uniref:KamA family radical SAM protein n=1 Tax=Streptomyces sp. NPDC001093 TaxID=3154376 RepID=UPI003327B343
MTAPTLAPVERQTPYVYRHRALEEPDWTRFPGWRGVTAQQWRSAQWQRGHCVKNVRGLRGVLGDLLHDSVYDDLQADQDKQATMSLLVPPQMLNTLMPGASPAGPGSLTEAFRADPVRRYMLPLASDRRPDWRSHPMATRDSLHESEMWAVEGLTHRYPNKVLVELVSTCPQYCGHCTRMDLVGNSTPTVAKTRFQMRPPDRTEAMLGYLRRSPGVRDVVVSGGDVANVPWPRLEAFVGRLLDIDHIRDIRLASKALVGLPQHWLAPEVLDGLARLADRAARRGVAIALHTHANAAQSVTPIVAEASRAVLATGIRDVRNQGVLLAGVNDSAEALLDLCFALLDGAGAMPYYFYLCDMIPESEHWRIPLGRAQELQNALMGHLPGFATPRLVCDVPYLGKRWVHQAAEYDRVTGVSRWEASATGARFGAHGTARTFHYYDPLHTLPPEGRRWWERHAA